MRRLGHDLGIARRLRKYLGAGFGKCAKGKGQNQKLPRQATPIKLPLEAERSQSALPARDSN